MTFGQNSNTRFANNEISTSGAAETISIVVSVTREARTGRVTLNETSDASLEHAMKRADELARVLPPDPEHVGPIPPQTYLKIEAFDEATARFGAADWLPGVRAIVEPAREAGMNSSGFFVNGATVHCIANQAGNFGYHRSSDASFSATVRTADGTGSGWAEDASRRVKEVDSIALAGHALKKARESANPKALDPGDYTVILEPAAVVLLGLTSPSGFDARRRRGRSFFSKKGGCVTRRCSTISVDGDQQCPPSEPHGVVERGGGGGAGGGGGFGGGGEVRLAARRSPDREGRAHGALTPLLGQESREGAHHAATAHPEVGASRSSLIASTERGLLVTRFWNIRAVVPRRFR
jgi:predicted Zn-dependent protease